MALDRRNIAMKWCAALTGLAIVGGLVLAGPGEQSALGGTTPSTSMYAPIEVTGVLTAAQELYREKDMIMFSGLLRVETASAEKPAAGQLAAVEYPANVVRARAMGLGDEVQVSLKPKPLQKAGTEVWMATATPTILGRGEFINPAQKQTTIRAVQGRGWTSTVAAPAFKDVGSPEARVLVKMFAPMNTECHRETATLLEELAGREPDRVRVQIFDMQTKAGRKEMQRERLQCATVLVNNRLHFTLSDGETERKVAFHHRPNTPQSTYRSEGVVAVVEQEVERLY
jgi:hypothetical protein